MDFDFRLGINVIAVHDVGGRIVGNGDGLLLEGKELEEVIDQTMCFQKAADRAAEKLKIEEKRQNTLTKTSSSVGLVYVDCLTSTQKSPERYVSGLFKYENGGEKGIRTLGRYKPTAVFKTAALDRSAISPMGCRQ